MAQISEQPRRKEAPKTASKATWKGKEWYEVVAPKLFNEAILTETPTSDVTHLVGRTVVVNAATLTGNPSRYYFKLRFRVKDVSGRRAKCEYDGHECSRDFISRMVRRRSRRIDTRDTVTLKDGKKIIVKLIATTIRPVQTSVHGELAKKLSASVANAAARLTLEEFIKEMLSGSLQKTLSADASKVYPLREVEINKTKVLA